MTDAVTWGAEFRDSVYCLYSVNKYRVLRLEASITSYLDDLHLKYDTTWLDTYALEIGILRDILKTNGFEIAMVERELYEIVPKDLESGFVKGIKTIFNLEPIASSNFDVERIWRSFLQELRDRGIPTSRDFFSHTLKELVSGDPSRNRHLQSLHDGCRRRGDIKRIHGETEPLTDEDVRLLNGDVIPAHSSGHVEKKSDKHEVPIGSEVDGDDGE